MLAVVESELDPASMFVDRGDEPCPASSSSGVQISVVGAGVDQVSRREGSWSYPAEDRHESVVETETVMAARASVAVAEWAC